MDIRWSVAAAEDLESICQWIERDKIHRRLDGLPGVFMTGVLD
jgi:plasmid stabilization system protein ParE